MIRNRFAKLRRGIVRQSAVMRVGVLIGAIVLFMIGQQFAAISNGAASGTPTMIIAGIAGIVLAVVAIYSAYVAVRSFIGSYGSAVDESNA